MGDGTSALRALCELAPAPPAPWRLLARLGGTDAALAACAADGALGPSLALPADVAAAWLGGAGWPTRPLRRGHGHALAAALPSVEVPLLDAHRGCELYDHWAARVPELPPWRTELWDPQWLLATCPRLAATFREVCTLPVFAAAVVPDGEVRDAWFAAFAARATLPEEREALVELLRALSPPGPDAEPVLASLSRRHVGDAVGHAVQWAAEAGIDTSHLPANVRRHARLLTGRAQALREPGLRSLRMLTSGPHALWTRPEQPAGWHHHPHGAGAARLVGLLGDDEGAWHWCARLVERGWTAGQPASYTSRLLEQWHDAARTWQAATAT